MAKQIVKKNNKVLSALSGAASFLRDAVSGLFNSGKSVLDVLVHKVISRKLLTFGIATTLLSQGNLESSDWTIIACIYIGVQGAIDFWKVRHGVSI